MAHPSFDLRSSQLASQPQADLRLNLTISNNWLTAVWLEGPRSALLRLVCYGLDNSEERSLPDQLNEILLEDPFFQLPTRKQRIIFHFEEAFLVPETHLLQTQDAPLVDLLCGNLRQGMTVKELSGLPGIQILYRLPLELVQWVQEKYPIASRGHLYTLLLQEQSKHASKGVYFYLNFFPEKLVVGLYNNQEPVFLQTYAYRHPQDISWYLLNLCSLLNFAPSEVTLMVSGLIDKDSNSFEELEKYFLRVQTDTIDPEGWSNEALQYYPAHYFSPVLKMAVCESSVVV